MTNKIPNVLSDAPSSTKWFYKRLEYRIGSSYHFSGSGKLSIPCRSLQTLAEKCSLKVPYGEAISDFCGMGILGRTGFSRGQGSQKGSARKYYIPDSFSEKYSEETYEETIHMEDTGFVIREDWDECSKHWYRRHIRPVFYKATKNYDILPSAINAINEMDCPEYVKQTFISDAWGDRWIKAVRGMRTFSSWTNTPRTIRPYARVNGQSLVEFDVRNLHPALIANACPLTDDIALMRSLCKNGTFYEYLLTVSEADDRQKMKKSLNAFINAETFSEWLTPLRCVLTDHFPTFVKFVDDLKHSTYKDANRFLMKQEWNLMFPLFASLQKNIARPNNTYILPLHDGIYVPEDIADEAEEHLRGLTPDYLTLKRGG